MVFRTQSYRVIKKPDTQAKAWVNVDNDDFIHFEIHDLGFSTRGGRSSIHIHIVNETKNESETIQVAMFNKTLDMAELTSVNMKTN